MNADEWVKQGDELLEELRYTEAEKAYRRAIDIDQQNIHPWNNLGVALGNQGKYAEAEQAYRSTIDIDQQDAMAWAGLGNALENQDRYAEAEQAYRSAIDIDQEDTVAWNNLGGALANQDRYAEAEQAYRRVIDIDQQDAMAWSNLGVTLENQDRYAEAETAALRSVRLRTNPDGLWLNWWMIAESRINQEKPPGQVLYAHRRMAQGIEGYRLNRPIWEDRLEGFQTPARALQAAAGFCTGATPRYREDGLRFAIQSKARTLEELLDHDLINLRAILPPDKQTRIDNLEKAVADLEMERHGWKTGVEFSDRFSGSATKRIQAFSSQEQEREWRDKRKDLDQQRDSFFEQVVIDHPELEPFVLGPRPRSFRFSLARLQRHLRPHEGALEFLLLEDEFLLGFLITRDGLVKTYRWEQEVSMFGEDSTTLEGWHEQVRSTLHIGEGNRAENIKRDLTPEVLAQWGQLLYGPFIDDLKDITRLWISPHSFLTQLPFNAIPFPDGIEREVAIIPSAASLTR
ncbi:tetratricopeptide repeat protein, partial [Dehalococcoidia bacterium]|nr:tetratricopeptide repeat protein [Dehalococcoidia bacterium]